MIRIVASIREKRSTNSQFENVSVGVDIEANNLELSTPEEIVGRTRQLFQMARSAVQQQLLEVVPERPTPRELPNGHSPAGGNGQSANGNGRSYGRPNPEPTAKQKTLLQKLAHERGLSAEQVGEISRREFGRGVPQLDKNAMSRLLEMLMEQAARP